MSAHSMPNNQDKTVQVLLDVMRELFDELHPYESESFTLSLDSSLDKDLRLDSLARVELLSRLEQYFDIVLPERVYVDTETPRDLLRAITSVRGRKAVYSPLPEIGLTAEQLERQPHDANTLIEALEWHVKQHPERLHIRILGSEGEHQTLTYEQLWQGAEKVARGLQQHGVQPGETVAIMLPTGSDYFFSFFAILFTGAIPVPIYPPLRRSQLEEHMRRHSGILNNCVASILITVPEAKVIATLLKSQVESLRDVVTVRDLATSSGEYLPPAVSPYDIAFLQYTSGSTGNPKGVVLTHENVLANIRVMGEAVKANSNDVFVSWLPLYHDMGLIAAWLGSLYFSAVLVVMSPLSFLIRPQSWLWAIHQYRGTLSASPNFGYELCLSRIKDEDLHGLDLSSWRLAFNGAEPVSPETIKKFTEKFQIAGFKDEIMMPVYGLAESTVGLAFPPLNRKPRIDCVQRESFTHTGYAIPAVHTDKTALCFVASGQPLRGHQIRIVDRRGRELPERQEGALQFRGPSVTTGYYRNPEATRQLYKQEWLDSGDLAYFTEGDLFITGRSKDVIIHAGRNVYPHELEEAIGNVTGVRKGGVVAFGAIDTHTATERLVILVETREKEVGRKSKLRNVIASIASDLIGLPPDEIILVPPRTVLKTSSGKLRRSACRDLYERGMLDHGERAVWIQYASMVLHSLLPVWRRLRRQIIDSLYAGYALLLFGGMAGIGWLLVILLPRLSWRWYALRILSQWLIFASGVKISVNGLHNLPPVMQPCVYVVNHASYIDSLVLVAGIPRDLSFVVKAELRNSFFPRVALQRLQVEFVERFDKKKGVIDAQRITKAAQHHQSLLFFPEGTFTRVSGLMDFHMGAFMTAAQVNIPVVPVAIRGTRSMLRADSFFPRRGRITVTIGPAISKADLPKSAKDDAWHIAIKLRDAARKYILDYCGEPSLTK